VLALSNKAKELILHGDLRRIRRKPDSSEILPIPDVVDVVTITLCRYWEELYSMMNLIFNDQPAFVGCSAAVRTAIIWLTVLTAQETDTHITWSHS
jgi:Mg/Co/Ni transporter MgtE